MPVGNGGREPLHGPSTWKRRIWGDRRVARIVALAFLVVGGMWIILEHDYLGGPSTFKDFLFLFATAAILYFIVDYGTAEIRGRETDLRRVETRLRSILVCDPSGVLIVDRDGLLTYLNPAARKILGLREENPVGIAYRDLPLEVVTLQGDPFPPEKRPLFRALRDGAFVTGEELAVVREDGSNVILSVNTAPLLGLEGETVGLVASFIDVTKQAAERQSTLRESRERYRDLVETLNDLVWETDREMSIRYLSPRFRDILGYDPEEWIGRLPYELMERSEAERIRSLLVPVIENARGFENLETTVRHRDGHPVHVDVSGAPYRDSGGTFQGWRGIVRDITRRKEAERIIGEKEEHFRQMFVQNDQPIILFRPGTSDVLDANPAAVALYGFPKAELLKTGLAPAVPPDRYEELAGEIAKVDAKRKLSLDGQEHVRRDGKRIIVSVRATSIWTISGSRFTYCTIRDVTERVRMEEEAKSRQAQLIHSNRMASLGKVVTGIAHELNNPNNLIMFNAPMIQKAWQDTDAILEEYRQEHGDFPVGGLPYSEMREAVPKLLRGISDASRRIRNFVQNLKGFARTESREIHCEVGVGQVFLSSVGILNHEIRKLCNRFQVDDVPDSLVVRGCRPELEQVMINLIHNALQSLPDGDRTVRVSASRNDAEGMVELVVRDEGTGMPPEVLGRISQPFFTTKQDSGGLGLGLSIVHSIVETHHGEIRYESEVGKGTTVRVLLPGADRGREAERKNLPMESR